MPRLRLLLPALASATLAGCYTPLPRPTEPVLKSGPLVEAGCLLPDKALFRAAPQAQRVDLNVTVEADGHASKVTVQQSSGNAALDGAFIAAALACRYTPAQTQQLVRVARTYVMTQAWLPGQAFTGPQRCFMPDYPRQALREARDGKVRVRFMLPGATEPAQVKALPPTDPAFAPAAEASAIACFAHAEAREGLKWGQWYEVAYTFRVN